MTPSRVRFVILALITFGVMVNYLDRAIIGIASPAIAQEFALSPVAMGLVFSAFSWSYFAAQLPGGLALDRFGARLVYLVAIAGWSLSTLMHATVSGFASLFGWRLSLGLFEAPCFPANNNIVGAWFPRSQRARAIGIYTSAEYVALGFATPLLLWLQGAYGWRALFIASGPAIKPLGALPSFDNVDIAPLLRDLLNLPPGVGLDGDDTPFRAALAK